MNIVLTAINAKYIHSNPALRNFMSYAADCKEHLQLLEYTINHSADRILEGIFRAKPDVLCFSCYIWNISLVRNLICEIHKLLPETPIWLGGPEVSFEAASFLEQHPQVTGIMCGEGESTFHLLAQHYIYHHPQSLLDIPGLVFRQNDKLHKTEANPTLDMDQLPFCYDSMEDLSHRIIYYESSRGCPFRCSYCLSSLEKSLRFRSLELVKRELSFFVEQGVPQVKFVDRTFNCNHAHALEIWKHLRDIDRGITNFHFEISADLLTDEELAFLETLRPGLVQFEIGVQSTNPATITEIHRQMNLSRLKEVVTSIRSWRNIHMHLDLIAGLPFEDYTTFSRSFDEIFSLYPSQLQLGFLKVLKGSYMYEHAAEYDLTWHSSAPYEVLSTRWLSYDDILRIKRVEEMLEVYYNSWQYSLTIRLLLCVYPSAFSLFQRLGDYYDRHQLFDCKHSRLARCEILLSFLEEEIQTNTSLALSDTLLPMFRESLVYDLYARENCKKRPDFACDLADYKQQLRMLDIERKVSLRHIEVFHYPFVCSDADLIHELPSASVEPLFYRFNYEQRDPLSYQAAIEPVTLT